jgi:hypothetical protein
VINGRHLVALLAGILVVSSFAGCGDDDSPPAASSPATTEDTSPTATLGPTTPPNLEAIEAAGTYLEETGIDGDTGAFTDPLSCNEITDDAEGDYCLHETVSIFAPGLTILIIGEKEDPTNVAWEVRLSRAASSWEVTSVSQYGSRE